jgi:hypothetical protein
VKTEGGGGCWLKRVLFVRLLIHRDNKKEMTIEAQNPNVQTARVAVLALARYDL